MPDFTTSARREAMDSVDLDAFFLDGAIAFSGCRASGVGDGLEVNGLQFLQSIILPLSVAICCIVLRIRFNLACYGID